MLSSRFTLPCGTSFAGRIIKSAMSESLGDEWNNPSPEMCRLYKQWSQNYNGGHVLITGNVQVDRRYMESAGNVCIDTQCADPGKRLSLLQQLASAAQQDGTKCLVQLSHSGRQSSTVVNLKSVAPSAIRADTVAKVATPRELTLPEIDDVVVRFANAAKVCKQAGFAGVEIHAGHGYLINQFLSPRANHRQDKYGGPLEARSLLLFQVLKACRDAVGGDYCIAVKLNASDYIEGGFTEDEAVKVAVQLEQAGVDLLDVSGGSYENPAMSAGPTGIRDIKFGSNKPVHHPEGYFLPVARRMRAELKRMPVMVTGGFRSKAFMEETLQSGACDFIGVARPVCGQLDSVSELLRGGEASELPRFESLVQLPWALCWLYYVRFGHLVQLFGSQALALHNARRVAFGQQSLPSTQWRLISDMRAYAAKADDQARKLQGMDKTVIGSIVNKA